MYNPPKPKTSLAIAWPLSRKPNGVAETVEQLLQVLEQNHAEPDEGMLSLVAAFTQTAHRVLDGSDPEDIERNRESLLGMLDEARRTIELWAAPPGGLWRVH